MTCSEAREYLFAFLDGELDAALSIEFQRHLEHCPECAREAEIERTIRRQLAVALSPQDMSEPHAALKLVMVQIRSSEGQARWSIGRWLPTRVRPLGLAAAAVILVFGGWFALRGSQKTGASERFADLLVADFKHFIEAGRPLQLQSTDPKEASAWLWGRTQVPVTLPAMHHGRCKLVGARSCKVSGRPAAFAFYEIDGQPASLVAVQGSEADLGKMQLVNAAGRSHWVDRCQDHSVVACLHDGLIYAAVSRLETDELVRFMSELE